MSSPPPPDNSHGEQKQRTRYPSRSDEEIRDEMSPRYLSYRSGWPILAPLPLDTELDGATSMVPDAPERLQDVQNILITQGLLTAGTSFVFAFRVPHDAPEDDDDNTEYLTLLLTVDTLKHSDKMEDAVVRIRSSFREYPSTEHVQIECIDYRVPDSLVSLPIRFDERSIIQQWEAVQSRVLSLLSDHSARWQSLECLRRGLIDDPKECPPTIVISTPTARDPKWFEIVVPAIRSEISDIAPDLGIEILCGVTIMGGRKRYRATDVVNSRSYLEEVNMGSSLGIATDDGRCSTLGGSITLTGGVRCGITNWHCVRNERLDQVVSKTINKALDFGNKTMVDAPQIMQSPATSDHHDYLGALQNEIENLRNQAADGDTLSKIRHKETDQEYKTCERFERGVGHVYAGSGRRTTEANKRASDPDTGRAKEKKKALQPVFVFPLDWALIRIDDTSVRDVTNRLPDVRVPRNSKTKLTSLKLCLHWSNFNVNKEVVPVAKFGRTSGWTFGTINSCMMVINPEIDAEISAVYGFTKKNPATCFGVTNAQHRFPFVEPGDSGSILVHDPSGTQLGLIFGVTEGGEGIFIPMDLVHQDIRRVTGKDVVEPSFVAPKTVGLAPC